MVHQMMNDVNNLNDKKCLIVIKIYDSREAPIPFFEIGKIAPYYNIFPFKIFDNLSIFVVKWKR